MLLAQEICAWLYCTVYCFSFDERVDFEPCKRSDRTSTSAFDSRLFILVKALGANPKQNMPKCLWLAPQAFNALRPHIKINRRSLRAKRSAFRDQKIKSLGPASNRLRDQRSKLILRTQGKGKNPSKKF